MESHGASADVIKVGQLSRWQFYAPGCGLLITKSINSKRMVRVGRPLVSLSNSHAGWAVSTASFSRQRVGKGTRRLLLWSALSSGCASVRGAERAVVATFSLESHDVLNSWGSILSTSGSQTLNRHSCSYQWGGHTEAVIIIYLGGHTPIFTSG